jgi:hypothetical protein
LNVPVVLPPSFGPVKVTVVPPSVPLALLFGIETLVQSVHEMVAALAGVRPVRHTDVKIPAKPARISGRG